MHSGHAARRQKISRLLQNTWVTRNVAVTQSVLPRELPERASARGHLNCHGWLSDGIAFMRWEALRTRSAAGPVAIKP
jgi:hypothetical protein